MRRMTHPRAFTLIETIAAIVIIAVAVPPMLWAIQETHISRANPVLASRARWLAVSKLEDAIADRHSLTRGYPWLVTGNYPDEGTISGYPGFSRKVVLTETEADLVTPGSGYMIVDVEVTWTDAAQILQTLSISTVLTRFTP